ncbi:MAG TPA: hypothetical protein VD908_01060 [Cytophagales bacterium]|nr:hypothetical protein [Cytophagales bacterium]
MTKTFAILYLLIYSFTAFSQSKEAIFKADEIVWFGLDFSHAKMIGSEGFKSPQEVQNKFFDSWNQLILMEPEKYNLKETFNKQNIIYDLTIVEKRNANVKASELVINKDYSLDKKLIPQIIKTYKSDQKKGIGLVFIVESFNKLRENGTVFITFFDLATKKVLLTEKVAGAAGGFGLRNYYGRSISNILKQTESDYDRWEKQ